MSRLDYALAWPVKFAADPGANADVQIRRSAAGVLIIETAAGGAADLQADDLIAGSKLKLGTLGDTQLVRTAAGVIAVQTGAGALARLDSTNFDALASTPRMLMDVTTALNAAPAATRGIGQGGTALAGSATNTTPLPIRFIDVTAPTFPAVPGKTAKLRINGWAGVNATAPGAGTFTLGLHPVTAVLGPTGVVQYTIGAAVAGTTVQFNGGANLAASTRYLVSGPQFDQPAANHYCVGIVNSGAMAAASSIHLHAWLELSYV